MPGRPFRCFSEKASDTLRTPFVFALLCSSGSPLEDCQLLSPAGFRASSGSPSGGL